MQLFNIGPVELILILVIMFILLGPEGMLKTARQIGSWIRKLVRSPMWRDIMGYSREIRELPTKLVRETGLEEDLEEIRKTTQEVNSEVQGTVNEANKEVQESLKETGNVDVRISPYPPSASQPTTTAATPGNGAAKKPAEPEKPAPAEEKPVVPTTQVFDKYSSGEDDEDDEE